MSKTTAPYFTENTTVIWIRRNISCYSNKLSCDKKCRRISLNWTKLNQDSHVNHSICRGSCQTLAKIESRDWSKWLSTLSAVELDCLGQAELVTRIMNQISAKSFTLRSIENIDMSNSTTPHPTRNTTTGINEKNNLSCELPTINKLSYARNLFPGHRTCDDLLLNGKSAILYLAQQGTQQ